MIVIEVWTKDGFMKMVNFYNPRKNFSLELLEELAVNLDGKLIYCGDFNAHSTLWDNYNDGNGEVIEKLMEIKNPVCLNDENGMRIYVRNGTEAIDLTLVSETVAGICTWEIVKETTMGSDHYPIITEVGVRLEEYDTEGVDRCVGTTPTRKLMEERSTLFLASQ